MNQTIDDNISNLLGLPTTIQPSLPVQSATTSLGYPAKPSTKLANIPDNVDDIKLLQKEQDFNYARESIHSMIDQGNDALVNLVNFANTSGGPEAYKVLGGLLRAMAFNTTTLMALHKDTLPKKDSPSGKGAGDSPNATQQNANSITNNYNTMTTTQAMEALDKEDIEDDPDLWDDDVTFTDEK